MSKLEILNRANDLDVICEDRIQEFESTESKSSNEFIKNNKNSLLTFMLTGSCLLIPCTEVSSHSIKIELKDISQNFIKKSVDYDKSINQSFKTFWNRIDKISNINKLNKKDIVKSILSFKSLNNNWDGYSSLPLEIESASNALSLIDLVGENLFCTINDFYPNPSGTISMIWKNNSNEIVSLEVGNKTMSYYVELSSQEIQFVNDAKINTKEAIKLSEFLKIL